ncbi:MAG TPA: hypothetical protein VGC24_08190, partial [Burkholderiaceae bacterium]
MTSSRQSLLIPLLVFVLCACWAMPVVAHRLDEYLQATMVDVEKDHVTLQMRLTPSVEVADAVLAEIDTDGDGVLSEAEQQAYAKRVLGDLSFEADGRPLPLQPVSSAYPPAETMRQGLGDIALTFRAELSNGDGAHQLMLVQRHQHERTVYLVNALLPQDPTIQVVGQQRSADQSSYRLDYTIGSGSASKRQMDQRQPVFGTFFWHGVRHILTGYDHLLFA